MFKRGWKSRRPQSGGRKRIVWLLLLVFLASFVQSFIFVEKNLRPPLMNLAKIRLKQLATQSINAAITDHISQEANFDRLIDWKTDKDGKVTGFMLNYAEHMRITSNTINRVQTLLTDMKTMPEHIPLGMAMNSAIFASFGPDIPIRLEPAGAVKVDLSTRYQDAGINMILVEVYIRIIAELTIIIPFDTEPEVVETELPISYLLVVGDTPMYYYDNKGNPLGDSEPLPPSVSLPNLNIPSIDEGTGTSTGKETPVSQNGTTGSGMKPKSGTGAGNSN
ncbi:MAG: sporulation protein YunB [Gorillibacterium sp.]|nr:sporulation protein YunB [Gorillibacterium sp.]